MPCMHVTGKITRSFIYQVVMYSTVLGTFVMIPDEGEYSGRTISVAVKKQTVVNGWPAESQKLDQILLEGNTAGVLTKNPPTEIQTATWTADAQYSAEALMITVR